MNTVPAGTHGVVRLPSATCPTATDGANAVKLVEPQSGGTYEWKPPAGAKAGDKVRPTESLLVVAGSATAG